MNTTEAKQTGKRQLENYLNIITTKKGNQYICPICGSGTGANKTPAGKLNKDWTYHCYSCEFHGDIYNLLGKIEGISDTSEIFQRVYDMFGIQITPYRRNFEQPHFDIEPPATLSFKDDYTDYYKLCNARANETSYFSFRGIGKSTVNKFMLGYDPAWRSPKALKDGKNPPVSSRVIIPTERKSYIARAVDTNGDPKYKAVKEGTAEIFNKKALQTTTEPIFIVEGEIDALSIIEAGGQALALGGTGNKRKFINLLTIETPKVPVILSLDNDKIGEKTQAELKTALEGLNISVLEINISGNNKDPNEFLMNDRASFLQTIKDAKIYAVECAQELEKSKKDKVEANQKEYIKKTAVSAKIDNFLGQIKAAADTPVISTNFSELDKVLDDGLYEGLYILGAISSLGKTSFILQIADQIAQQRQDVLIFSLEMSETELMAKSISRLTYLNCGDNIAHAKTTRGITAGRRYASYSEDEKQLINDSVRKYAGYADNLFIFEGMGDIGAVQVREITAAHIESTGNKPVVIIDYLQILAPSEPRANDKYNMDKSVFELKRLSRDLKIPVIGISSLNRENYNNDISMSAFKESGGIEYSSDVLIGLQFEAVGSDFNNDAKITANSIDRLKREEIRKIELKILKNRNAAAGDRITFDYHPMFNYFKETGKKKNGNSIKLGNKRI